MRVALAAILLAFGVIAAAQGRFDVAIEHQHKALGDKRYAEHQGVKARARLRAYESKKPFHE